MSTFSESLAEINARVSATLNGVDAASELLVSIESGAAGGVGPSELLERVNFFVDEAYGRIKAEMGRRDSVFFDLELLKLKRGEVAAVESGS